MAACADAVQKMRDTIKENESKDCFGLAANQIGLNVRACIVKVPSTHTKNKKEVEYEFYNPEIIEWSGSSINQEWCYSLGPAESYIVKRYPKITIHDDKNDTTVLTGIAAFAAQHEIDHLNGKLISDKGTPAMEFLNHTVGKMDRQTLNSLCKCGSGKKYKRCCGK
jgi:peptide deformylase